jgi:hypothetical protein
VGEGRTFRRVMPAHGGQTRSCDEANASITGRKLRPSFLAVGVISGLLALGCSGCGGGSKRPPPPEHHAPKPWKAGKRANAKTDVCIAKGRAVFASRIGVSAGTVKERRTVARSGAAECVFTAGKVVVSVSVSGAPEAYAVLERQAEEQAQIFGGKRFTPAPQLITGLGVDAYWFPAQHQVMTTEGVNLIAVTIVHWPHTHVARRRALGTALARPYVGKTVKSLLRGPAPS